MRRRRGSNKVELTEATKPSTGNSDFIAGRVGGEQNAVPMTAEAMGIPDTKE